MSSATYHQHCRYNGGTTFALMSYEMSILCEIQGQVSCPDINTPPDCYDCSWIRGHSKVVNSTSVFNRRKVTRVDCIRVRGRDLTYNEIFSSSIFIFICIAIDQAEAWIRGHWVGIPFTG